jgi:hypothetical protein
MLTRLIVNLYTWIIEISLWSMLLISGVVGYFYTVPMLNAAGLLLENETAWQFYGALVFAAAMFLMLAVLTGPFLVLVDIQKSVRFLEMKNGGSESGSRVLPAEHKEPSL